MKHLLNFQIENGKKMDMMNLKNLKASENQALLDAIVPPRDSKKEEYRYSRFKTFEWGETSAPEAEEIIQIRDQDQKAYTFSYLNSDEKTQNFVAENFKLPKAFQDDFFCAETLLKSQQGALLKISKNESFEKTFHLDFFLKNNLCSNLFVYLEEGASLNLRTEYKNEAQSELRFQGNVFFVLEREAQVKYFVQQNCGSQSQFILRQHFELAQNAQVKLASYHQGVQKGQHRVHGLLKEKGANFDVQSCSDLNASEHFDFWATSEHDAPYTTSDTQAWNILRDNSTAVFNATIVINKNCPQSEAYQQNKSLLLSEKAKIHSMPKLEISTDDVKCSHGASISSVDANQLFYLKSRGISEEEAQLFLIEAFRRPLLLNDPCFQEENIFEEV